MTLNSKKEEYLIYKLADNMKNCIKIDADLFRKLDVKRGLRNEDGTGVLVGLTISAMWWAMNAPKTV